MAEIKFEIVEHIAVLAKRSNGWTRELNVVSWNGQTPKVDIRDWSPDKTSMKKGITLNRFEFLTFIREAKKIKADTLSDGMPSIRHSENETAEAKSDDSVVPFETEAGVLKASGE